MPFSKPYPSSVASDLPTTFGFLATLLEVGISLAVTVAYITTISLFLAYNTFYKAVDMSALYALKYAEALKIPVIIGGIAVIGSVISRGLTNVRGGVANVGWVVGGAIGRVLTLPEDLISSIMFERQCPLTAQSVKRLRASEDAEKRLLLAERDKKGGEMV